ncbi:hypothetical protein B7494_g4144 [Chlorociboria aeruginascens]|nr:hypothetical protein B7494_g4144 [Chlorociboria aeruginascens]
MVRRSGWRRSVTHATFTDSKASEIVSDVKPLMIFHFIRIESNDNDYLVMSPQIASPPPPPPQWVIDLNSPPISKPKATGIPDPPGYSAAAGGSRLASKTATRAPPTTEETDTLKLKKAWEVALAPVKQLPMTAIMMYMSGNSLQIFSIMMVGMAFKNPIMGLVATNQAFERFESEGTKGKLIMVKAVYVAMQILALALGIWKVNGMGLLPTTRSDWLAWETARQPLEVSIPAF